MVHREVEVDVEVSRGYIVKGQPSHHLEQSIRPVCWISGTRDCESIVRILCSTIITILWDADLFLQYEVFYGEHEYWGVSRMSLYECGLGTI